MFSLISNIAVSDYNFTRCILRLYNLTDCSNKIAVCIYSALSAKLLSLELNQNLVRMLEYVISQFKSFSRLNYLRVLPLHQRAISKRFIFYNFFINWMLICVLFEYLYCCTRFSFTRQIKICNMYFILLILCSCRVCLKQPILDLNQ